MQKNHKFKAVVAAMALTLFALPLFAAITTTKVGQAPICGVWSSDVDKVRARAERDGLPVFIVASSTGCEYCTAFASQVMNDNGFKAWQASHGEDSDQPYLFLYVKASMGNWTSGQPRKIGEWVGLGSLPRVSCYYSEGGSVIYNAKRECFPGRGKDWTYYTDAWFDAKFQGYSNEGNPYYYDNEEESEPIEPDLETLIVAPGEKIVKETYLIGYKASGLPTGLKYDSKTGKITGSCSKPTAKQGVQVFFTKSNADSKTMFVIVSELPKLEVALDGDTDGCKVTGAGSYLVGKLVTLSVTVPKGTKFVGWFEEGEKWPNETDYTKTKLSYSVTAEDIKLTAKFEKEKISIASESLASISFTTGVTGAESGIPLNIETQTGIKTVSVKNLPSPMKYDAATKTITGAPGKAGDYNIEVSVTATSGAVEKKIFAITVAALPSSVVGTFNGFVGYSLPEMYTGTFSLTATDAGKLSAKVVDASGTYSFTGNNWDKISDDGIYSATLKTKKGEVLTLELSSDAAFDEYQLAGTFTVGGEKFDVSAQRKVLGTPWYLTAEGDAESGWTFGYAESSKDAALTVTVKADGSTSIAGKLGGVAISTSGSLDISGLQNGALIADFAPVVSIKEKGKTVKKVLGIKTNLSFDRNNEDAGSAQYAE